jgi:group I intron endonuclease
LEILEYCDLDLILKREQFYIDNLKPIYNILKLAGSPFGYLHTEEAKAKISEAAPFGEKKEKIILYLENHILKKHAN